MRICLLITCTIPAGIKREIAEGRSPRMEYLELARLLSAEIFDYGLVRRSKHMLVRCARLIGKPLALAVHAWLHRRDYDAFYVGSELTGIILAALLTLVRNRPRLAILNHYLSNPRKAMLLRLLRLEPSIDVLVCMNEFQARFLQGSLQIPGQKIVRVHYGANVDGAFFAPDSISKRAERYFLSVGRERRDYDTLLRALNGGNVHARIVSSGIRDPEDYAENNLAISSGNHVEILSGIPFLRLKELYTGCAFVVLPLHDVEYPAGITSIMESMSMGKTVIATRSRGIVEFMQDGVTGFWVAPGNADELREKILYLWNNPDIAEKMGTRARLSVADRVDLTRYVRELGSALTRMLE